MSEFALFAQRVVSAKGLTVVDDHHYGGSLKHVYCNAGKWSVLGAYGVDELAQWPDALVAYNADPAAALFACSVAWTHTEGTVWTADVTVRKPILRDEGRRTRNFSTEWTLDRDTGHVHIAFLDDLVPNSVTDPLDVRVSFWQSHSGVETERARVLADWNRSRSIKPRVRDHGQK